MKTGLRILLVAALLAALCLVVEDLLDDSRPALPARLPGPGPGPVESAAAPAAESPARQPAEPSASPVAGEVLRPDGRPLQGARVTLHRENAPWPELDTTELEFIHTGADGRFTFRTPRGPDLVIRVEHDGFASLWAEAYQEDADLTLTMAAGFEVSGLVLDPLGRPVPRCTVVMETGSWDLRRAESVTTDRRGAFRLPAARPGIARVSARHPAYQPAVLPSVTIGASEGLTLRFLASSLVLSGDVVTTDDPPRPVSGATVRALPNTWNGGLFLPHQTATDGEGRFRLPGLGPGNLRIEVRHPDHSTTSRLTAMGPSTQPLQIEMGTRSRIHGRLVASVPLLESAALGLVLTNTVGEQGRTAVAPDGSFEFPGTFSAGPAALEIPRGELAFTRTSSRDVGILVADSPITELELAVMRPSVVEGVARDESGGPVGGALILLRRVHQKLPAPEKLIGVTGADGGFRIRGMPVGTVSVRITHKDFATRIMGLDIPPAGQSGRIGDVVLSPAGSIFGRVTLDDGSPVAGALVSATRGAETVTVDVTEPDGRYRLRDLSPGRYRLRGHYSTLPVALAEDAVEVEAGVVEGPVPLLFPAGRSITGTVEGSDGQPLADVPVTVSGIGGAVILTDSSGRFSLEVPRRELTLQAYAPDFSVSTERSVGMDEDRVTLRLDMPPSGSLSLRVFGLPGRRPVPGGIVRVSPLPDGDGATPPDARSIASQWVEMRDGVLQIPDFPAGRSRFVLQCQGYGALVKTVVVQPRRDTDLGEVLLEPGNTVRGTVTGPDGSPVPGAHVFLGQEVDYRQFPDRPGTATDAEGRFSLRGVTPDSRSLVVATPAHATRTLELRIPEDILRKDPLPVSLERGSTIRVAVLDAAGQPWEMSVVMLRLDGTVIESAYTDENGSVSFTRRSPGNYEISLFGSSGVSREIAVEGSGKEYSVELRARN